MKPDILYMSLPQILYKMTFESRERAEWESVKRLTKSGMLSCACYSRQARAPWDGF